MIARILIDGGILTAIFVICVVVVLYFNPRIMLSDYPELIKAKVPARTKKETQIAIIVSIPLFVIAIVLPLYSVWLLKEQTGELSYWLAFATIFAEYFLVSMFDLIVLDLWMFFAWTPKFLVLPGTEGMPAYKDWRPHTKEQLTTGNLIIVIASAVLAIVPAWLF